jgi:hypothetical protein
MTQTLLALDAHTAAPAETAADRSGFDLGWDHAHHGLVPPAELLLDGTPIGQGWRAGRAVFGRRTLAATHATRVWLALRLRAWREGVPFENQLVTAHYVAQLQVDRCPVTRQLLGGAPADPDAAVVERLNPLAGYAAGNLAQMSQRAAAALRSTDVLSALRHARRAHDNDTPVEGLDAGAWWRLATLRAYATPMPFYEAARLPLAVLPPNRVRLLNTAQGLQALLTMLFCSPGWSARCREIGALLPEHTVRQDYNLFVGALAPRLLEAGSDPAAQRRALEDAWLRERVQRRWQHFLLSLGEAAAEVLVEKAAALGLAGVRTLHHAPEQATEGWSLPAEAGSAQPQLRPFRPAWQRQADRRGTARSPRAPAPRA